MYQKTVDRHHLHRRTGSHATKGSGRGTVWWNIDDPEAYNPDLARKALKKRKRALRVQYATALGEFKKILEIHRSAMEQKDFVLIKVVRPSVRAFSKNLKQTKKEIEEIEHAMRALPKPAKKVRHIRRLLTGRELLTSNKSVARQERRFDLLSNENIPGPSVKEPGN